MTDPIVYCSFRSYYKCVKNEVLIVKTLRFSGVPLNLPLLFNHPPVSNLRCVLNLPILLNLLPLLSLFYPLIDPAVFNLPSLFNVSTLLNKLRNVYSPSFALYNVLLSHVHSPGVEARII